ncbi:Fe-only hydrogenase maturation protein HydE [Chitinispirillum alkaliphilum]|nr:Fe-only hydrogenase maturation protein HydE [Chitinispirillum alkaliphilum]
MNTKDILEKKTLEKEDLLYLVKLRGRQDIDAIKNKAQEVLLSKCGGKVYYRGLVEFSNICSSDCFYCGIRKSNTAVNRFMLDSEEVVEAAKWCAEQGYGSIVLQSGERSDPPFINYVEEVVRQIKKTTVSDKLSAGLGITLCVGEQSRETYRRFYKAGAHRYLLRIESSNPQLFASIHPPRQTLQSRIRCLEILKEEGFQVGTGVMIGLPGQNLEHLVDDILFFRDIDVDMIGMGPYIVHSGTDMKVYREAFEENLEENFIRSLLMIALTRLTLRDVNIAATTALQTIKENGREQGLDFGANVIMPQLTPVNVRKDYMLYEDKPCIDESKEQCRSCLERRIKSVGREVALDQWGDSPHYARKKKRD